MKGTALLKVIIDNAQKIQKEFGAPHLYASHVAAAVAEFCSTSYAGICVSDKTYFPCRFEEERLRYVFSKEVRIASYFRMKLSRNAKIGLIEKPFDKSLCIGVAQLRGNECLSADLVFLVALKELDESYKMTVNTANSNKTVLDVLKDADKNVYDYAIKLLNEVVFKLQAKADEAARIRDWRPAAKFAEPEELAEIFFNNIETKKDGNVITLKFPEFFGETDLSVSIHKANGIYYIHDNGCAIKHLSKHVSDKNKLERVLKRVCANCWISGCNITGVAGNARSFLCYLQMLVFIANADLFYTRLERPMYYRDKEYIYVDEKNAMPIDEAEYLEKLKGGIGFNYDEDKGLYCWLDMTYALFSTRAAFLIDTLDSKRIRISDYRKGKIEGEIFEAFYWNNDELILHHKYVCKLINRFGGDFDGENVYLTEEQENVCTAFYKFFNMAVLLSEYGHTIRVLKPKRPEEEE